MWNPSTSTSESEKKIKIPGPAYVVESSYMSAPDGTYSMYPSLKCSE